MTAWHILGILVMSFLIVSNFIFFHLLLVVFAKGIPSMLGSGIGYFYRSLPIKAQLASNLVTVMAISCSMKPSVFLLATRTLYTI